VTNGDGGAEIRGVERAAVGDLLDPEARAICRGAPLVGRGVAAPESAGAAAALDAALHDASNCANLKLSGLQSAKLELELSGLQSVVDLCSKQPILLSRRRTWRWRVAHLSTPERGSELRGKNCVAHLVGARSQHRRYHDPAQRC
jgi:hypothetical protein